MKEPEHYKNYVGQYVKRFYTPFEKENIFKIKDFRVKKKKGIRREFECSEFLYSNGTEEWWADCEDSCIITNEHPVKEIDWVANVNSVEYKTEYFNPFKDK